jgi:Uma2 family endonuclease
MIFTAWARPASVPVEGRLELIEGEIIAMAPIGSRHAAIVTRANLLFVQAVADRAIVSVQNPIILGQHSEPEPDLAVIQPRDDFYALALPRADEVFLIVEVADTTLRYDREIKIPLFARHGIPEVWLIDVEGRTLTVFETPADGRYPRRAPRGGCSHTRAQGAARGRGGSVATLRNGMKGGLEWPNRSRVKFGS